MGNNTTNNVSIPNLAIKMNRCMSETCPLCNGSVNPNIGFELVEDVTNQPVCRDCGLRHAVDLVYLLSLAESARLLVISERDYGVQLPRPSFHFGAPAAQQINAGGIQ